MQKWSCSRNKETYMFELDDGCKIIENKTLVIKETCSWLPLCCMYRRRFGMFMEEKLERKTAPNLLS